MNAIQTEVTRAAVSKDDYIEQLHAKRDELVIALRKIALLEPTRGHAYAFGEAQGIAISVLTKAGML